MSSFNIDDDMFNELNFVPAAAPLVVHENHIAERSLSLFRHINHSHQDICIFIEDIKTPKLHNKSGGFNNYLRSTLVFKTLVCMASDRMLNHSLIVMAVRCVDFITSLPGMRYSGAMSGYMLYWCIEQVERNCTAIGDVVKFEGAKKRIKEQMNGELWDSSYQSLDEICIYSATNIAPIKVDINQLFLQAKFRIGKAPAKAYGGANSPAGYEFLCLLTCHMIMVCLLGDAEKDQLQHKYTTNELSTLCCEVVANVSHNSQFERLRDVLKSAVCMPFPKEDKIELMDRIEAYLENSSVVIGNDALAKNLVISKRTYDGLEVLLHCEKVVICKSCGVLKKNNVCLLNCSQ